VSGDLTWSVSKRSVAGGERIQLLENGSSASFRRLFASLESIDPDPTPFRAHLDGAEPGDVIAFENLGRDALLIVPRPLGPPTCYAHLASFVRCAPAAQQIALWQAVGRAVRERIGPRPFWLSTAGMGVSWLHVRLDQRPKYYRFQEYKAEPRR
jgi:hypothetical protein